MSKFWDKQSKTYGTDATSEEQQNVISKTKKYLKKSEIVLDYGCATGLFTFELAPQGRKVHGIDISKGMIDVANEETRRRKLQNVTFSQGTIFDEQLLSNSFDVILAFNILHLVESPKDVLKKIYDLLKPNGYIVSSTTCLGEGGLLSFIIPLVSKLGIVPKAHSFEVTDLEEIVKDNRFSIIESENIAKQPPNQFIVGRKELV